MKKHDNPSIAEIFSLENQMLFEEFVQFCKKHYYDADTEKNTKKRFFVFKSRNKVSDGITLKKYSREDMMCIIRIAEYLANDIRNKGVNERARMVGVLDTGRLSSDDYLRLIVNIDKYIYTKYTVGQGNCLFYVRTLTRLMEYK